MLGVLAAGELAVTGYSLAALPRTLPVATAVLYLGVASTAAAWSLWYKGLERPDSGPVAVFFFAQPVVGAALAAAVLVESLGPTFLVGGAVMAAGVYLVNTARAE